MRGSEASVAVGVGEAEVDKGEVQGGESHRAGPHGLRGCSSSRTAGITASVQTAEAWGLSPSRFQQQQPRQDPEKCAFSKASPHPSAQRPTCRAAPGQLAPRSDGMGPRSHACCLLWTQCLLRLSQKPQLPEPPPASRQPLSTWNRQARPVTLPTGASHLGGSHGGWPLAGPCAHLLSPGTGTVPCRPVLGAGCWAGLSPEPRLCPGRAWGFLSPPTGSSSTPGNPSCCSGPAV